jgi:hypothetical protein
MRATGLFAVMVAGLVIGPVVPASAVQDRTADAALAAAERNSDCLRCEFGVAGSRPEESARRGLVTIGVSDPRGGGAAMIMAYTGSAWGVLWEGNGSTRNVESLPGRVAICMNPGGWTNIRKGPGLNYRRVGKVSTPTIKKVFEVRLTSQVGRVEGVAWYRISVNGRPAWVQNMRTLNSPRYSAAKSCSIWREYWETPQRFS